MPKPFYKSRVKMFLSRWKVVYVWILMWLTITESAFSALRKTMNPSNFQSATNSTKNQTKFGRKLSSTLPATVAVITSTSTFVEATTFKPIFSEKNLETEKIVDQILENKNQKNESGIADKISENIKNDGLLWRSMTDGKSWTGYLVPETNVNISLRQPELPLNNVEPSKIAYQPGSHTYIYATSPSPPSSPYTPTQNGPNKYIPMPNGDPRNMPAKYNAYDTRTRSPRYGTPAAPMTMMMNNRPANPYPEPHPPQQQYHQQQYSQSPPTSPPQQYHQQSYSYSSPAPPQQPHYGSNSYGGNAMPSGSPTPSHSYGATPSYNYNSPMPMPMPMTPGYGMPMMAAAKEDTGLKGLLSKLLALLPVGLLLAVALPSLIVFPTRRSLEGNIYAGIDNKQFKNKLTQSYPILDMIKYYGFQTFQNASCFRYIVCETVKMGSEDGANAIQKQLWTIANRLDANLARSIGLNDLWEGITKNSCEKFSCDWNNNTNTTGTNKPDKLEKVS